MIMTRRLGSTTVRLGRDVSIHVAHGHGGILAQAGELGGVPGEAPARAPRVDVAGHLRPRWAQARVEGGEVVLAGVALGLAPHGLIAGSAALRFSWLVRSMTIQSAASMSL